MVFYQVKTEVKEEKEPEVKQEVKDEKKEESQSQESTKPPVKDEPPDHKTGAAIIIIVHFSPFLDKYLALLKSQCLGILL